MDINRMLERKEKTQRRRERGGKYYQRNGLPVKKWKY
jgi:hypothetical protein